MNNETDDPNCWLEGEFEDAVAAALIACYETKIKKSSVKHGFPIAKPAELAFFRRNGPYIPGNDREVLYMPDDRGYLEIDPVNDLKSARGVIAWPGRASGYEAAPDAYMFIISFERCTKLPKRFKRQSGGPLYKITRILPGQKAVFATTAYVTVDADGIVCPCDQWVNSVNGYVPGVKQTMLKMSELEPVCMAELSSAGSAAFQFWADKRHVWSITATENTAKATLGCMKEEVKSLLYARTLPMTATGRKRPILHLVAAHQRRMKNGTDVDISTFLRGVQTVEFGGTEFTVKPPDALKPKLTVPSQERYYPA